MAKTSAMPMSAMMGKMMGAMGREHMDTREGPEHHVEDWPSEAVDGPPKAHAHAHYAPTPGGDVERPFMSDNAPFKDDSRSTDDTHYANDAHFNDESRYSAGHGASSQSAPHYTPSSGGHGGAGGEGGASASPHYSPPHSNTPYTGTHSSANSADAHASPSADAAAGPTGAHYSPPHSNTGGPSTHASAGSPGPAASSGDEGKAPHTLLPLALVAILALAFLALPPDHTVRAKLRDTVSDRAHGEGPDASVFGFLEGTIHLRGSSAPRSHAPA